MIRVIFCLIFLQSNFCQIAIANVECNGQLKPIGDTSCNDFLQPPSNFGFVGVINRPLNGPKPSSTTAQSYTSKSSTSRIGRDLSAEGTGRKETTYLDGTLYPY